jgi:hypothetical protein
MCAKERGANATTTHSDSVAIISLPNRSANPVQVSLLAGAFSWLNQNATNAISVRWVPLYIGPPLALARQPKPAALILDDTDCYNFRVLDPRLPPQKVPATVSEMAWRSA